MQSLSGIVRSALVSALLLTGCGGSTQSEVNMTGPTVTVEYPGVVTASDVVKAIKNSSQERYAAAVELSVSARKSAVKLYEHDMDDLVPAGTLTYDLTDADYLPNGWESLAQNAHKVAYEISMTNPNARNQVGHGPAWIARFGHVAQNGTKLYVIGVEKPNGQRGLLIFFTQEPLGSCDPVTGSGCNPF